MRIVVLGGAGAMGQIVVRDLAESEPVTEVVIADLSLPRAQQLKNRLAQSKLKAEPANIADHANLVSLLTGATAVVNCSPYKFNIAVMEAALSAGCHYLDLGGLFHTTRKQLELNDKFKEAGLLAVLGMGAAPGMTNVMAAYAANDLDQIESIDMYVAGVDFVKHHHPCLPPYALETILDEYALEPMVFEGGQFIAKPPMSGEMSLDMPQPVGLVKAFLTIHSEVATLPLSYRNKGVKQVTYRLGLPEEFHERMKFLVDLGFGKTSALKIGDTAVNPRQVLAAIIDQHPVPDADPDDCEVIRVDVSGTSNGRKTMVRMESTVRSCPKWKVSCGALDTGVPPSIVAQMIALGLVKTRGALPPESCVPAELFFLELSKRSIPMRKITDEVLYGRALLPGDNAKAGGTQPDATLSRASR